MAEVFRAVTHGPAGFQRQFVIKRIRKEKAASKDFVDMFINEARISALLEHPNIVQVYDFGQVEGDYFLAMEYLRGRNLLTVGRRVRVFARSEALVRPVWYCGIVVATAPRAFRIQMDGLPPAWFLSKEQWTYVEPLPGESKTPKPPSGPT